jgi:predicted amidohydrolase
MRVHLVQIDSVWEDRVASRERALRLIEGAGGGDGSGAGVAAGDLVILPEMFETGFSFNLERTADADGTSRGFVRDLAQRFGVTVVAGVTVPDGAGKGWNRAVVFGPGGELLAEYDKTFLFPLGERSEASLLMAGRGVTTFEWKASSGSLRVGPLICYDLRFPELFGRVLAAGAEAIALIANWPAGRAHHWRALSIARAIECQAYVFAVNRSGRDPMLEYLGGSMIISPKGEVIAEADGREQVLSAEIDRRELDHWRRVFPAWRDRLASM